MFLMYFYWVWWIVVAVHERRGTGRSPFYIIQIYVSLEHIYVRLEYYITNTREINFVVFCAEPHYMFVFPFSKYWGAHIKSYTLTTY